MHTTTKTTKPQRTNSGSSGPHALVWRLPCACGGTVKVERGTWAEWVFVCSRCGGGKALIDKLSVAYNIGRSRILDGPQIASELPWEQPRRKQLGPAAPNLSEDDFRFGRRHLWNNRQLLAYLRDERGLSDESIRDAQLGYLQPNPNRPPGIIIPVPPDDPVSYRIRYWPDPWLPPGQSKPVKIATPRGHQQMLYPRRPLGGAVILAEGEFDCLISRQHGLRAVAVPGCQVGRALFRRLGRKCRYVGVCFDQGEGEPAQRAIRILSAAGAEAWAVDLGLDAKGEDLTDWFVKYGRSADDLRELIREARRAR